jgi:hypothetical protein
MNTYTVRLVGTITYDDVIEADSEKEALEAAKLEALECGADMVEWTRSDVEQAGYNPHPEDIAYEAAREYADEDDERAHQAAHMPRLGGM